MTIDGVKGKDIQEYRGRQLSIKRVIRSDLKRYFPFRYNATITRCILLYLLD